MSESSSTPAVEARDLVRDYPRPDRQGLRRVLAGVELTLRPGEAVLITGNSGSGKTTLLSILAGLERAHGGTLQLFGEPTARFSAANWTQLRRERLGLSFQAPQLLADLTVRDNALLPLLPRGLASGAGARWVDALLDELGLAPLARATAGRLSGGEQQRVALVRALAGRPALLLLDEPAAHLDPAMRELLARRLQAERARGAALLLTSHEGFGRGWVDRQLHLADGRLTDRGPQTAGTAGPAEDGEP